MRFPVCFQTLKNFFNLILQIFDLIPVPQAELTENFGVFNLKKSITFVPDSGIK